MPDNPQDLSMELAKAREQLETAWMQVAALEAQLSGDHPDSPTMPPDGDRDYRTFDHLLEGCQIIDFDWHYRYVNETAARQGLRAKDELIGHTMMELYPGIEQTEMFTALQRSMQERTVERIENEFIYPDGTSAWFDLSIQPVPEGIFILSLDITERTRTLEEIEILARFPSENPNPVLRIASDGSLLYANPGSHHLLTLWGCEVGTRLPEDVRRVVSESFAAGTSREIEVICDNTIYSLDIAPVVDAVYANVYGRDITKRTRAEINIRKLNRTLSMLSDINQAIVRIRHLPTLFETACQIAVEKGGFRMAWIGLLDEAAGRVTPVAHAGIAQEYLNNLNIVLNEERNGEGAIALALLKGEHIVVNDVEHDSIVIRSRDEALRLGYLAMAAFPLKVAGEARAAFGLYATETDFFDDDELRMLDEIAGDIAFAMEFAEQEAQREQVEIALERHAQRLEILHEIDIGIINADSIQKVVETALRNIRRLIPCQRANVGLIDHEKGEGVIFALALDGDTKLGQGLRVPLQAGLLEGYDTRHLKVVEDLRSLQESNPRFKQGVNEGLLSALNVLLMDRDQPIGTLGLFANTTGFFTEEYQEITIQIASQLAIAIRQMRLSEALQRHAAELEKRVEERTADLTETKERVEAILNNSLDGILLVHPDLSIQQTNVSFNHLFGCDQDDYFGKSLVMLIHAQDADTVDRLVQGVFQEQQGKRAEIRAIRKDGGVFEAELSVGFIKGDGMACAFHDITERKQAEEALRQSTVEIQDLYNNAPCGYHSIDRDGVIVQINDTELRWMGYTREELVGKLKITDIFTPESIRTFQENFPRFKERGWVNDLEFDVVCKDGSIMHILLNGTAIYDEGGQYLKSRSTLFDMTDLKRTQQALADSEARYRQMFERNQAIKLLIDPQTGAIVDANPAACAYYGYDPDTLRTMNITQINTAPKDVVRAAMRQTQTETQSIFEFQHQLASGDIRDVEVYSCSINIQGKSLLYGIIMDITERKRAEAGLKAREENYRQLVETMRGGLAVRDVDNRCTYVNDRFCELLGYSRDEVIGANLFDFLDEANTQVMESQFKRRQNLESASFESVFIRKDGRPVHMLISGSPLFDKNGGYNGSFAVMTDITTQKQAQETLRQALAKEKELGDLKTRFVSMASHEFRTPLATILALVETLSAYRHKLSEDQIDQRFDKIKVQVGHLKDIMEDVLLLARMQARRVDFDPARIDLDSLCRSVLDEFLNRADVRHPIHYSCDVMLQDVLLDKKLMRQMLSNLVSNAIKYSPPDKPIHVRLEYEESAVILEVRDFGMGIPEADLPHLFEPFHRAANVDTIPGTGLGLVIIKESVDLHGGTITVDSQLDMGTTFMINIPITTLGEMTDDENSDH